jgi:hypothetical protein
MSTQPETERIDAPALWVEARYGARTLSARVLSPREARGFTIGSGRGADAPVDTRYLPANDNHTLVAPDAAGFVVHLPPALRAHARWTGKGLRVPCGEVVFDISAAEPPAPVPRTWRRPGLREEARITGAVALGLLALLLIVRAVPSDPHALSLDDLGRDVRLSSVTVVPPVPVDPPKLAGGASGGGARTPSSGRAGEAGDRRARPADARRATRGPVPRQDARAAATWVHENTMLAILDGSRLSSVAALRADTPALGSSAMEVLAHIEAPVADAAFGPGGLSSSGTGEGGAGTGRPMIGGPPGLGTIGKAGDKDGSGGRYGRGVGDLGRRQPRPPTISLVPPFVRGALDKEIVRRVVRQHINEVRACYEQSLVRRPTLAGRVVVQFTIAPTGQVLASALQASTLGDARAELCIVAAPRRWPFPQPAGGGLVTVSYPFQLAPAGG